jgi:peptide/nickel transport system substrate-binding protein
MQRSAWQLIALISLTGFPATSSAETRPHYGGTLAVEIHDAITFADPGDWPPSLIPLVYDGLVRLDKQGRPRPALALAWQHDPDNKRWEFQLRPGVKFHDGSPVNAAAVAACLKLGAHVAISGEGGVVVIQEELPAPDLPVTLADARFVILRRGADGVTSGTGSFRIAEWQAGRHAVLAANDDYWGGRPYLDGIELRMFRAYRDQSVDLELGKADVVELSIEDARRATQRGLHTWASEPFELIALAFERSRTTGESLPFRQAVAVSIDRNAIHDVLLQRQGESSGALLPQWITGYAFLFPAGRDLERARQIAAAFPKPGPRAILSYDAADPLLRSIAERVAVDAREAGVLIQVAPGGQADMQMARVPLRSPHPALALFDLAAAFHIGERMEPPAVTPEARYQAEKKVIDDSRVIPLCHLPEILGIGSRVKNWEPQRWGNWRLDNVWVEPRTP